MDEKGLAGGECRRLALVRFGNQRQIWVCVHVRGRLMSASSQPSLCLKDVDDYQRSWVSRIYNALLASTRSAEINESALLMHISFRDATSGGFHCSTGDIELVYWWKLGSSYEILLDPVYYPYAHSRSWYVVYIETISRHHTHFLHHPYTSRAPHLHAWRLTFQLHRFYCYGGVHTQVTILIYILRYL